MEGTREKNKRTKKYRWWRGAIEIDKTIYCLYTLSLIAILLCEVTGANSANAFMALFAVINDISHGGTKFRGFSPRRFS
jgi:hypothetical protein